MCPDYKTALAKLHCRTCEVEFEARHGVPNLLPRDPRFRQVTDVCSAYDEIYEADTNGWLRYGRGTEFLQYYSSLIQPHLGRRYLEIGCGEGYLLAEVDCAEKHATDLSVRAIQRARGRADARFYLALAERLPFPTGFFDVVGAVGVMEHFLDGAEALSELHRVLVSAGHLNTLSHVRLTIADRAAAKLRQFVYPRPKPLAMFRWLLDRSARQDPRSASPKQPIQNYYTTRSARSALTRAGFEVEQTIHSRKDPSLPLIPRAVVFVCRKSGPARKNELGCDLQE